MGQPTTITVAKVEFTVGESVMTELCQLWDVEKTHTTPYHWHANRLVERRNYQLGDSHWTLLLTQGQKERDTLLSQLMRSYRGTPHLVMGETANLLMLG